ncbi:MAG: MATE family efflux transporter [Oscillospiraceae bacterium]
MGAVGQYAKYVSLNILSAVGISVYILADTFFISLAEGADGITALNLVLPVYSLIFAIGSMIGIGSATRFAILRARGDKRADGYFFNAVFFAMAISLAFMAIGGFCPDMVVRLLGGDERITGVGAGYTRIFMLFTPFFMLNYIFTSFVRNDKAPSVAMAGTLTSSLSNILLDYLFMFPLGMGMRGAALATGISPIISVIICSTHFFSKGNTIRFLPRLPSLRRLGEACALGVSAFVSEISSGVTTTVFNFIILGLAGNVGVAAYGVIANFAMVAASVFNGIMLGSQPLVSRFYGSGDNRSAKKVLHLAQGTALVLALLILAAVVIFAPQFTAIFNSEGSAELAAYAETGMRIYFTGFIFAGFNIVGTGFLSATERAGAAFVCAVSRGAAAIVGFAFLLSALLGMTGVWLAFPAAELLTAAVTMTALLRRKKARNA